MTWDFALRELCLQLDSADTIKDVLNTAIDENMISPMQGSRIAREVGIDLFETPGPARHCRIS